MVLGSGFMVHGSGCRDSGLGLRVKDLGFRVQVVSGKAPQVVSSGELAHFAPVHHGIQRHADSLFLFVSFYIYTYMCIHIYINIYR